MPRIHCPLPLHTGAHIALPPAAARHVQVLRMQPGDNLTLFNGEGGEFSTTILRMGRSDVAVEVGPHDAVEREAPIQVHLALGMPANDRMDWLVEKATELGVTSVQPLVTERSVLRLSGDRALKKQAHWQSIAVAACEQSGRNRVPVVHAVLGVGKWLEGLPVRGVADDSRASSPRLMLSFRDASGSLTAWLGRASPLEMQQFTVLSGPEGGLSAHEETLALTLGFAPVTLGNRVLRAETAPLALLGALTLTG